MELNSLEGILLQGVPCTCCPVATFTTALDYQKDRTGNKHWESWEQPGWHSANWAPPDAQLIYGLVTTGAADWIAKIVGAKIAGAHCRCWHQSLKWNAVQLIFLLAIDKEERLVLPDGSAKCSTILVQVEFFCRGREVALGIQRCVPQKLKHRAVEVIRS